MTILNFAPLIQKSTRLYNSNLYWECQIHSLEQISEMEECPKFYASIVTVAVFSLPGCSSSHLSNTGPVWELVIFCITKPSVIVSSSEQQGPDILLEHTRDLQHRTILNVLSIRPFWKQSMFEIHVFQLWAVILQMHLVTHTLSPIFCKHLSKRCFSTLASFFTCASSNYLISSDEKEGNNQLNFVRRQREEKYLSSNAAMGNVSSRTLYVRLCVVLITQKVTVG